MPRPKIDTERKQQILSALETCVVKNGLAKTSLQDVADAAALPRPLVRYFVGNRDEMITKLFESIIERGEKQLAEWISQTDSPTVEDRLDLLFDTVFANETSNSLVSELWYLANREPEIRVRLNALYQRVAGFIAEGLANEGLGVDDASRTNAAISLIALAYGEASLRHIGLTTSRQGLIRKQASAIIADLSSEK